MPTTRASSACSILRKYRAAKGITQSEAALEIGVSTSTYQSWELGRRVPGAGVSSRVAAVLGMSYADMLKIVATAEKASKPKLQLKPRRNIWRS